MMDKLSDLLARRISQDKAAIISKNDPIEHEDTSYSPDNKKLESIKEISVANMG